MIEEKAIVVGLSDLGIEPQKAELQIFRDKPCGLCGKTQGCGISLLGQFAGHQRSIFSAINVINAKIGDIVVVGVEDKALVSSALFLYGFPLFGLMFGAMFGSQLASTLPQADLYAGLGAILGLVFMVILARFSLYAKNISKNAQIVLLRK